MTENGPAIAGPNSFELFSRVQLVLGTTVASGGQQGIA
jgi:hypothetical protein